MLSNNRAGIYLFIFFAIIFLIHGCSDNGGSITGASGTNGGANGGTNGDTNEETAPPPVETQQIEGSLIGVEGATIPIEELQVFSFANSSEVDSTGEFSVEAPKSERYQSLIFSDPVTEQPVYLGLYNPETGTITASDTSTALSLTLMNPYLIFADQDRRHEYLEEVQRQPKFEILLSALQDAYQNDASLALDYDSNSRIYQLVAELTKEAMESLGEQYGNAGYRYMDEQKSDPYIEDGPGDQIAFVNPRFTWYAAGIREGDGEGDFFDVFSLDRRKQVVEFHWGFPPRVGWSEGVVTEYNLGDGYFQVDIANGFDLRQITDLNNPVGRATLYNTGQSIFYIIDALIGFLPPVSIVTLPNHMTISDKIIWDFSKAVANRDAHQVVMTFISLLADNAEGISYWIWQETQNNAQHHFIESAAGIVGSVSFATSILGMANEEVPFFWDLITATSEMTYFVTQNDGEITSMEENNPPVPNFSVSPQAGIVGTEFEFDATMTSDDHDDLHELEFRWDVNNDGHWNIGWSNSPVAYHVYEESGSYQATLEVRDTGGLTSSTSRTVNVGGGANTATNIKLFMDDLPWNTDAMIEVLESLGFTEGFGEEYQYQVIPSEDMATIELIPGEDLVIISNDQDQTFYDRYAESQIRFNNFAYNGGSLFWEACDLGWASGSITEAGITLPGNVEINANYDNYNYVVDQNLPLVSGLPDVLDHNYASHESFSNLPDGSIVYTIDSNDDPTLVEYNFGDGWVLLTGQPLEHQYRYMFGEADMSVLLPRIITYFTGSQFEEDIVQANTLQSVNPFIGSGSKE